MKKSTLFILTATSYLLVTVLSGCAVVKEAGKGFVGVSTQVLEEKRKESLKKSYALDYNRCYLKVKEILSSKNAPLSQNNNQPYIYAQDYKARFIAVYLSSTDTTCVGIFFTEQPSGDTLIEISSPSIYAKEEIANRIFTGIDKFIKPKI